MTDIPKNLRYTKTHEWLKQNEDEATVGITNHAQKSLGDMVFVELPEVGEAVHAGDELGVVESVKTAADFYAPVSGVVIAINQKVSENPALVNQDPYDKGWLVKIKIKNKTEIAELLPAEKYELEIAEEE